MINHVRRKRIAWVSGISFEHVFNHVIKEASDRMAFTRESEISFEHVVNHVLKEVILTFRGLV